MSLYGDSFTFGHGVDDDEAWSDALSRRLGCRVANYGVGGYGSDQALLRFEQNTDDEAPVVVLAHLSENIMRNVNRMRGTLYPGSEFGLKPRFLPDDQGGLMLLPLPAPSAAEFEEMVAGPEAALPHDFFVPGGASGKTRLGFPYTLSLLAVPQHFHVRAILARVPWYAEFYADDHASEALEVTARVLERFVAVARERGKKPVAAVLPTGLDLIRFRETGEWVYAPLLRRLEARGTDVVDFGPPLEAASDASDPCSLFLRCDGHLNAAGNRALADAVAGVLAARGLAQPAPPATSSSSPR